MLMFFVFNWDRVGIDAVVTFTPRISVFTVFIILWLFMLVPSTAVIMVLIFLLVPPIDWSARVLANAGPAIASLLVHFG